MNLPVQDGFTALHIAAQNGDDTVVDALLRAGATVNMNDDAQWTPLFFACQYGHLPVVSTPFYHELLIYCNQRWGCIALRRKIRRLVMLLQSDQADMTKVRMRIDKVSAISNQEILPEFI